MRTTSSARYVGRFARVAPGGEHPGTCSRRVSFDSRYGTWLILVRSSVSAAITLPSAFEPQTTNHDQGHA
jgi:hypothetical protein